MNKTQREKMIQRYLSALDNGDMDGLAAVLSAAERDKTLGEMILQAHEAYEGDGIMTMPTTYYRASTNGAGKHTVRRPVRYQGYLISAAAMLIALVAAFGLIGGQAPAVNGLSTPAPIPMDHLATIKLENINDLQLVKTLGNGALAGADLSPDGTTIALGGTFGVQLRSVDDLSAAPRTLVSGDSVRTISYSGDGQLLVGAAGKDVRVWNASTSEVLRDFPTEDYWISTVAFSADGTQVMAGGCLTMVRFECEAAIAHIWDMESGEEIHTLQPTPVGRGYLWAFTQDGSMAAFSDWDSVQLYMIESGEKVAEIKAPEGQTAMFNTANFTDDGKQLLLGGYRTTSNSSSRGIIWHWDVADLLAKSVETDLSAAEFVGLTQSPSASLAISPDGSRLITSTYYADTRIYDLSTGALITTLGDRTNPPVTLLFSPDNERIVSFSYGGLMQSWDGNTGEQLSVEAAYDPYYVQMLFNPTRSLLIANNTFGGPGRLWDINGQPATADLLTDPDGTLSKSIVFDLVLSPDGKTLAYTAGQNPNYSDTRHLWLRNMETGEDRPINLINSATDFAFADDQTLLIFGQLEMVDILTVLDVETETTHTIKLRSDNEQFFFRSESMMLAFNPVRQQLAMLVCVTGSNRPDYGPCDHPEVRLWDTQTGTLLGRLHIADNTFFAPYTSHYDFSTDGNYLVGTSCPLDVLPDQQTDLVQCVDANQISLWDVSQLDANAETPATVDALFTLDGFTAGMSDLGVYTLDDGLLMGVMGSETAQLWRLDPEAKTGELVRDFHMDGASVTLSADGELLAVGTSGEIMLWGVPGQ